MNVNVPDELYYKAKQISKNNRILYPSTRHTIILVLHNHLDDYLDGDKLGKNIRKNK